MALLVAKCATPRASPCVSNGVEGELGRIAAEKQCWVRQSLKACPSERSRSWCVAVRSSQRRSIRTVTLIMLWSVRARQCGRGGSGSWVVQVAAHGSGRGAISAGHVTDLVELSRLALELARKEYGDGRGKFGPRLCLLVPESACGVMQVGVRGMVKHGNIEHDNYIRQRFSSPSPTFLLSSSAQSPLPLTILSHQFSSTTNHTPKLPLQSPSRCSVGVRAQTPEWHSIS